MDYTADELLDRGQLLISSGQPDLALPFLQKLLAAHPGNTAALDLLGEAHFDLGNLPEAKRVFEQSVQLGGPDEVGTKWMMLGQLTHGEESLRYYTRGMQLLERDASHDPLRRQQLAAAHVNVAELYMSDLCMIHDAEERCEWACAEAQRLDPESLEAVLVTASMRISQCRVDEAKELLLRIGAKLTTLGDEHSYDFRLSAARLLVEVEENNMALTILERLVLEDDEIAEVWMLMGLIHQEQDKDTARECYERALELLTEFAKYEAEFAAMADRANELLMALDPSPPPQAVKRSKKKKQHR